MKSKRQEKILELIAQYAIETQEELLERLSECGIPSTQATVSRDIKQLHLYKEPCGGGRYRYASSARSTGCDFNDRLQRILRECSLSVDYAQNLVVLKTMPGLASEYFAVSMLQCIDFSGYLPQCGGFRRDGRSARHDRLRLRRRYGARRHAGRSLGAELLRGAERTVQVKNDRKRQGARLAFSLALCYSFPRISGRQVTP